MRMRMKTSSEPVVLRSMTATAAKQRQTRLSERDARDARDDRDDPTRDLPNLTLSSNSTFWRR
jgi:hypothetical protein